MDRIRWTEGELAGNTRTGQRNIADAMGALQPGMSYRRWRIR